MPIDVANLHRARQTLPQRVVVTGVGMVTSIGTGKEIFWRNLLAGESGIGAVESFSTESYPVHCGAEIKHFAAEAFVHRFRKGEIGRTSQFAIAAARLALQDADLSNRRMDLEQSGVVVGTTSGEPSLIENFDDLYVEGRLSQISPDFIRKYPCSALAAHIARELGLGGDVLTIPTACAAGNYAIAHALDVLRAGRASVMLAGGADSFSRITYAGFSRLGAISPELCQPFDLKRKGMIPGEGSAMLVLERLSDALRRGARIYAELAGYGLSCDAHHMTAAHPQGEGAARAMQMALLASATLPGEVDYISAHGTGTPTNDRLETIAIKRVFQEDAYRIPISSIKSMLGHSMGAASAIEAIACVLAINDGQVPATINLENLDPECDLDFVPNHARDHNVKIAMNNAYAFGGNNSSVVFKRFEA
jgi:3-oxoacyl-[acyl-carrier-protein] synthase II